MKELIQATKRLSEVLRPMEFSAPWVYRPLEYAWKPHEAYLKQFGNGSKRVLLMGMNPGPFGMAQTGVPFGEIAAVRDWMGIEESVDKPEREHPKRPIEGFACQRSEVSGRRLWGLFSQCYPDCRDFFRDHFVLNYCPLVWMSETGANLTPDKLPSVEMRPVEDACLGYVSQVIRMMNPEFLVGVGAFAEERLHLAAQRVGHQAVIGKVLHPSPASPAANRGWAEAAKKQLVAMGAWSA